MGKFNSIHSKFWTDQAVEELSPKAKLVFLYLLTSPHRTPSGLYSMTQRRIARDTGLRMDGIKSALKELASKDLVLNDPQKSYVLIVQAVKYLHQKGERMRKSVVNDVLYNNTHLVGIILDKHPFIIRWIAEVGEKNELKDEQRERVAALVKNHALR